MEAADRHDTRDMAVEALGGTPADVARPPVSPVRTIAPPAIARRIAAFDACAERAFHRIRGNHVADRVFYGASALGDFSLVWHLVATARAVRSPRRQRAWARMSTALAVESVLVNVGVKSLFRRARPVWEQPRPRRLRRPRSSSFPSGHATSAFLAAGLLAEDSGRAWPVWYGVAAVVAASRVHVKIHHASDVVGGAVVGFALSRIVRRMSPLERRGE
jgi:membrane-associated phospholipid phosphatase